MLGTTINNTQTKYKFIPVHQVGGRGFQAKRLIVRCCKNVDDCINLVTICSNDVHEIIIQTTSNGDRSDRLRATITDFDT